MATKILPFGRRLLIQVDEKKNVTPGGIHLPDIHRDRTLHFGTVLEVGKGAYMNGHWCCTALKPGDRVMFRFSGERLRELDGNILLSEDEVQCILVEVPEVEDSTPPTKEMTDTLVQMASDGNTSAQAKLATLAQNAGWSNEDIYEAPRWSAVADMTHNPKSK